MTFLTIRSEEGGLRGRAGVLHYNKRAAAKGDGDKLDERERERERGTRDDHQTVFDSGSKQWRNCFP